VEVLGSRGWGGKKNDTVNNVEIYSDSKISRDKVPYFFLERYEESYITEMQEFIDCVQKDLELSVEGNDGLQAVLIAKAAMRSMEENRPVKLSEIKK
jgi:myo-inositol 2-dehydrogenase / D-chiro-inositol 1-dehydrogenase